MFVDVDVVCRCGMLFICGVVVCGGGVGLGLRLTDHFRDLGFIFCLQ